LIYWGIDSCVQRGIERQHKAAIGDGAHATFDRRDHTRGTSHRIFALVRREM
jgi:hypothetical protein